MRFRAPYLENERLWLYALEAYFRERPSFSGGVDPLRSFACCHLSARCGRSLTVLSSLLTGSTDTIPMDVEGRRSARAIWVVTPLTGIVTLMGYVVIPALYGKGGCCTSPKRLGRILLPNRTRGM